MSDRLNPRRVFGAVVVWFLAFPVAEFVQIDGPTAEANAHR